MTRETAIAVAIVPGLVGLMTALDPGFAPWVRWFGLALVALMALGMVYAMVAPKSLVRSMGQGLLAMVPVFAVVLLMVLAILNLDAVDLRLRQALLAGVVVMSGWLATFLTGTYRDAARNDRTRNDTLSALQSEVTNFVNKLDNQAIRGQADKTHTRMRNAAGNGDLYHPFSTTESAPIVFETVSPNIPLLSPGTVGPVLRFYAEYTDLRSIVEDLRRPDVLDMDVDRRIALHEELTKRRTVTLRWGLRALTRINAELGVDNPDEIPRSGKNPEITP